MKDQTALAYINMFAVLGTLENLCELDEKAKAIIADSKPVSIGFSVKDGPKGVLSFENGKCKMLHDETKCDIKLPFSSPTKFNKMIDGTATPIPVKGFTKVGFLLHEFIMLTDRLTELMRPSPEALEDLKFKELSTTLMCYCVASAVSEVGNHDFIGKFSARNTSDGDIGFEVAGGPSITVSVKNHKLETIKSKCEKPSAVLEFGSMEIARNIFDNAENAMACVCEGKISVTGMIGNIDNINRILDRVSYYLA